LSEGLSVNLAVPAVVVTLAQLGLHRLGRWRDPPLPAETVTATAITGLGSGESMSSRAQVPARFRERAALGWN
jgi:hypothetical protein